MGRKLDHMARPFCLNVGETSFAGYVTMLVRKAYPLCKVAVPVRQ